MPDDPPLTLNSREAATLTWIHGFAPYGVITTNREMRVQSWNRWMEVHSGKNSESVLGQELFELFPELLERGLGPRLHRALDGEISVLSTALHSYLLPLEPSTRDLGFTRMQQTARIAPLRHENEIVGVIIVIEDVTQREFQASVLRRQHDRDKILSWALAHLLEAHEPLGTIRDLFYKVAEHFDLDAYLLYLREPAGTELKLYASGGIAHADKDGLLLLDGESAPGSLFLNVERPRALENLDAADSAGGILHSRLGFRACVLLPLIAGDEKFGAFCLATRTRTKLQEGELDLLSTIGQYLAISLGREATRVKLQAAQAMLNQYAQDLERQVNDRTVKLREIIAELETFSHTVAHDLRAPIRALTGYCVVLIEDYSAILPPDARAIVDRLYNSCNRLDVLTEDLLEFTKVSRQEIQLGPVDLEAAVSEVLSLLPVGPGAVVVRRPLHPVLAHRTLLQQCLSNLIDNALKFVLPGTTPNIVVFTELMSAANRSLVSPEKQPFTPARYAEKSDPGRPEAALAAANNQLAKVRIVVQDNGIGIAPAAHGKIFGIFERGTSSVGYRGSGIGLAIVARAMQRMGGACGVDSQLGDGSRFWLELPAAAGMTSD